MDENVETQKAVVPDLQKIHEFMSQELQRDRDHFDRMFKRTAWFVAALVFAAGGLTVYYGSRTVQEARSEARSEAKRALGDEIEQLRKAVADRINTEFQKEHIKKLVENVARERSAAEFSQIILRTVEEEVRARIRAEQPTISRSVQEETKRSVTALQPTIQGLVESETRRRVESAVKPIEVRLDSYLETATVANTAILAKNGDRNAFDQLSKIEKSSNPQIKLFAERAIRAIVLDYNQPFRAVHTFNKPYTKEELLKLLKDPYPVTRRTAVDTLVKQWSKDTTIVRPLAEVIMTDSDLGVCGSAFEAVMGITGEKWMVLDFLEFSKWWSRNQSRY